MKYVEVQNKQFRALTFTADGRFLVSLHPSGIVRFWSVPGFEHRLAVRLQRIPSDDHRLTLLGRFLLTPTFLYHPGETWERLDAPSDRAKKLARLPAVVLDLQPGGTMLAGDEAHSRVVGGSQRQILVWDLAGKHQSSFEHKLLPRGRWWGDLAVSPDGQILAGGTPSGVELMALDQPHSRPKEHLPRSLPQSAEVRRLCFSADGRFLATGAGRSAWLWDLTGEGSPVRFEAFRQYVERVAFHPSGRLFAAGSRDGEVHVYETSGAKEVLRLDLDLGEIRGLAFAPDGMTAVAAGRDKRLAVWDVD